MGFFFRIKHHFFISFREIFVHHHGSLNFRAKIFALVIAVDEQAKVDNYVVVKKTALDIYDNDENRATFLVLSTKELVQKVKENNGLYIDTLIANIQKELKIIPRYEKKIDIEALKPLLSLPHNQDTIDYQKNILHFLEELKEETLQEMESKKEKKSKEKTSPSQKNSRQKCF